MRCRGLHSYLFPLTSLPPHHFSDLDNHYSGYLQTYGTTLLHLPNDDTAGNCSVVINFCNHFAQVHPSPISPPISITSTHIGFKPSPDYHLTSFIMMRQEAPSLSLFSPIDSILFPI